jgi:endoglucanase
LADDERLILTVHYYEPFRFTHQGASWVVGMDMEKAVGTQWRGTPAERAAVQRDIQRILAYGRKHRVPVHIGEFGAFSRADLDSRVRWTTYLARSFEEAGFSWAYWEFSAGFGIYDPREKRVLQPLADALLKNPMPLAADN